MGDAILTLNAGSSSLKFSLHDVRGTFLIPVLHGQIEAIGGAPQMRARAADGAPLVDRRWTDGEASAHGDCLGALLAWIEETLCGRTLSAVGHRVVHGGRLLEGPALVDSVLLEQMEALCPLAPLHQPHNLAAIRAVAALRPGMPQVACFDTAFHRGMPDVAARLALPRRFEADGLRRYGFHGLSYEFIARRLRELAPRLANGRLVVAHLGNGASLCAMRGGRSVDTTMGFTALDGLMMGTRCGALDPGVVLHLQREYGMGLAEVEDVLYRQSGLLGVSGISNDMRALLASEAPSAREAVELFAFRASREAAALVPSLGGLDGLVFTGGIGERAAPVRAMICARLEWLGVAIDEEANAADAAVISSHGSRVEVRVVPTDEEAMIARHTLDLVAFGRMASAA